MGFFKVEVTCRIRAGMVLFINLECLAYPRALSGCGMRYKQWCDPFFLLFPLSLFFLWKVVKVRAASAYMCT